MLEPGGGRAAIACLVLAILGVLFGCSDGSSESDDGSSSTTEGENDQAVADSAVLTSSDVPSGWQPTATAPELENMENSMARCTSDEPVDDDGDPRASASWEPGPSEPVFVGSKVEVNETAADAEAVLEFLRTEEGQACAAQDLVDAFDRVGQQVGDVTYAQRTEPELGEGSVALRAAVPLSDPDAFWFTDLIVVKQGDDYVEMAFGQLGEPYDADEVVRMTEAVLDRVSSGSAR